ncbi:hypothetical protein FG99_14705 [Pseudomonas sp. AAC]|nr:hypothetical protein FG99_14705 [Pseudomonas sp. AAC]KRV64136.1 hypothetical protein AO742_26710 [Pseudomonas citronellolis]KRW78841.1 hypothetical protein AO738_09010 [Pseudomonas citronellolis]
MVLVLGLFPHPSPLPEGEGAVRAGWEWGFSWVGAVLVLKSALFLTLSLKGEGTVGQNWGFWSQSAAPLVSG